MRVLVFGTGDYYQRYKKWLNQVEIPALIDNDSNKQGQIIDGVEVISPNQINKFEYDKILILSFCYKEMKAQLISLGVDEQLIFHFYTIRRLIDWKKNRCPRIEYGELDYCNKAKKVLLLSPELNNGGPAIALFHVALEIKKRGFQVVVGSMIDGELRERYLREGIPVIIDFNLQMSVMKEEKWVHSFDLIFCNTLNFYVFLSERNQNVPCIWWLHEADFFYDAVDEEVLKKIPLHNMRIVAVGDIPKNALKRYLTNANVSDLLYSVEDLKTNKKVAEEGELELAVIGYLEEIKGHDILLSALNLLPEEKKNQVKLLIVGYDLTLYGAWIKRNFAGMTNVEYLGVMQREQLHALYEEIDMLVCPSRQDSMPTVVAEAMMHGKASLVSDAIGTTKYIKDGQNGLIFHSQSEEELAKKIEWCIDNRDFLPVMGKNARKTYEEVFSEKAFEKTLKNLLKDMYE